MKQIADTVTLSFLEEDNKQRVIFRVFPLCTKEGVQFSNGREVFPDEGGLRVVPDKREQSTFKERMRSIGPMCVISLISDGKELTKVRPNRNYAPAKGEINQNAIYSDVICGFQPDAVFEVISLPGELMTVESIADALTGRVLIERGKVLYGPIDGKDVGESGLDVTTLKPFGNDAFLLQTITLPDGSKHTMYWNPEQILSWRLKRGEAKSKGRAEGQEEAASVYEQEEKAAAPAEAEAPIEEDEAQPESEAAAPIDAALPIGTRLNILDETLAFDDQITQLDQPLSAQANFLRGDSAMSDEEEPEEIEPDEAPVRVVGTPLVRSPANRPRMRGQQESMQRVVEQQLRQARAVRPGVDLPPDAKYEPIDNPIEDLGRAIEKAWQSEDVRRQAVQMLAGNKELTGQIFKALHQNGQELHLLSAAQAQLEDIEAERLSLMMQLEKAKEDQRGYEKQLLDSLSKAKTGALDKLKSDIAKLEQQRSQLENSAREDDFTKLARCREQVQGAPVVLLAPIMGTHNSIQQMVDAIRGSLSQTGFACTEDNVQSLLINLGLFDQIKLRANSVADARLYAQTVLEALGLLDSSAMLMEGQSVALLLEGGVNDATTPVIALREKSGSSPMSHGYKTILLTCDAPNDCALPSPTISVPPLSPRTRAQTGAALTLAPTSMASLNLIVDQAQPLLDEGEKWFTALERDAKNAGMPVDAATGIAMRRFVSVAAKLMRGGFLGAADEAVAEWVAPSLIGKPEWIEALKGDLSQLPKTLEMLGV